eukprot:3941218-Rhodomonas_salina.1
MYTRDTRPQDINYGMHQAPQYPTPDLDTTQYPMPDLSYRTNPNSVPTMSPHQYRHRVYRTRREIAADTTTSVPD